MGPLEEQQPVLLTAEPSLQPHKFLMKTYFRAGDDLEERFQMQNNAQVSDATIHHYIISVYYRLYPINILRRYTVV